MGGGGVGVAWDLRSPASTVGAPPMGWLLVCLYSFSPSPPPTSPGRPHPQYLPDIPTPVLSPTPPPPFFHNAPTLILSPTRPPSFFPYRTPVPSRKTANDLLFINGASHAP